MDFDWPEDTVLFSPNDMGAALQVITSLYLGGHTFVVSGKANQIAMAKNAAHYVGVL